ncbi:Uncharacterised protein [Yersinia enterocolitica]|nr:Uncharacterised protein [Yersinia enterocolitica]
MQWHHRHFDRKGDKEAQHQQPFHIVGHRGFQQIFIVESPDTGGVVVHKHQPQNGDQHDKTAGLGIDEELGGRRDTGFTV